MLRPNTFNLSIHVLFSMEEFVFRFKPFIPFLGRVERVSDGGVVSDYF